MSPEHTQFAQENPGSPESHTRQHSYQEVRTHAITTPLIFMFVYYVLDVLYVKNNYSVYGLH
jgi:hypothetical protein